jgi:hypothetical protein
VARRHARVFAFGLALAVEPPRYVAAHGLIPFRSPRMVAQASPRRASSAALVQPELRLQPRMVMPDPSRRELGHLLARRDFFGQRDGSVREMFEAFWTEEVSAE